MYRFFLVCIHLRYPVCRKGGREAYQEEVASRRSGMLPTPSTKKPKYAYSILGLWTKSLGLYSTDELGIFIYKGVTQNLLAS